MDVLSALILGIIQGLTEFLPVSSSGHLELGKAILGANAIPEESLLFTVVVHFATALATLIIYRKDVLSIISGIFKKEGDADRKFALNIIISMIPAALVGILFDEEIEQLFTGQIMLVGFMLIVTGLLLFLADKAKSTEKSIQPFNALIIGISQAIAILPGISRSGATISTSVLLKVDRSKAARFSFLMVVPLILGKITMDVKDGALTSDSVNILPMAVGFSAAFISGLFACKWMISLVKKAKLAYFSYYCFIVGILAIVLTYVGY